MAHLANLKAFLSVGRKSSGLCAQLHGALSLVLQNCQAGTDVSPYPSRDLHGFSHPAANEYAERSSGVHGEAHDQSVRNCLPVPNASGLPA